MNVEEHITLNFMVVIRRTDLVHKPNTTLILVPISVKYGHYMTGEDPFEFLHGYPSTKIKADLIEPEHLY